MKEEVATAAEAKYLHLGMHMSQKHRSGPTCMSKWKLRAIRSLVHVLCLLPFAWLTFQNTPPRAAQDVDPVRTITNFTGDWALYILLASLAITPVRRFLPGLAWLVRLRRLVGLYAFFYATLHLAAYVLLFSGYDLVAALTGLEESHPGTLLVEWKAIWPTVLNDVLRVRYIQAGYASWLILLALACTSPLFMLRVLGGKRWRWLHRSVYVAAVAGVIHFWWLVRTGLFTPWKDTVALAVLLAVRLAYSATRPKELDRRR